MVKWRRALALTAAGGLALPAMMVLTGEPSVQALTYDKLKPIQKRLLSGAAAFALSGEMQQVRSQAGARVTSATRAPATAACPSQIGTNVKVNQNCLNISDPDLAGRGQAQNETSIAENPLRPSQLVTSYNDYRRGDGNCYSSYSTNGGKSWQDSTPPMSFTRGTNFGGFARQYWQGGGDTSVAWDTRGNAYLSCQMFKRGQPVTEDPDLSSAFYVFRSTGTGGASWNFPGRPVVEQNDVGGTGANFLDKQLMTVDDNLSSPFRDRIYVTWTLFAADGTAYIYEAHSADYGQSFSAPVLVSRDSATLCPNTFGLPTPQGACNENQFSQPFVGPDGALYVTWANFNNGVGQPVGDPDSGGGGGDANAGGLATTVTPKENFNQMLLAKSTDGGAHFGAPVLVGQYYDLPDCDTYQGAGANPFRACVPEAGPTTNSVFRAANYPVGSVNPLNGTVAVTFASYINSHSNEANGCVPTGVDPVTLLNLYSGVKVPGACNNDVLVSVSTDRGATFTGSTVNPRALPSVRPERAPKVSDQFWQWAQYTPRGVLVVAYRDRGYGTDQTTGFTDTSVSAGRDLVHFTPARASTGASPPPSQFSGQFAGDYEGLSALSGVHPIWTDTRAVDLFLCPGTGVPGVPPATCTAPAPNAAVANDEEIYTATTAVPRT